MTPEELASLISQGETSTFELKSNIPPPDIVARVLGSFANTEGGTIAFGVQEPQTVLGVDPVRTRRVIESASKLLSPPKDVRIEAVPLEGKQVVLAHIGRSQSLVGSKDGYFVRSGDSSRAITAEEIKTHFADTSPGKDVPDDLAEALARQTKTIEKLTEDFAKANSMKRKIVIGFVGAVFGAIMKAVVGLFVGGLG